jgi:hypothetical protein
VNEKKLKIEREVISGCFEMIKVHNVKMGENIKIHQLVLQSIVCNMTLLTQHIPDRRTISHNSLSLLVLFLLSF